MNPHEPAFPFWLKMKDVASITQLSLSSIKRFAAEGRIDSNCGRKFGKSWRFKRDIILNEGLILTKQ